MTTNLVRVPLAGAAALSAVVDPKFKHNRLSVNLVAPLAEETVSDYAVLPFLLRKGSRRYPDFTQLNRRLDALYGASLEAEVGQIGANQIISLTVSSMDDRFALAAEPLARQCAELLRELVFDPNIENEAFGEESTALERQYLVDTIEAQINDRRAYAMQQCRRLLHKGDPAGIMKYGSVEGAKAVTGLSAASGYRRLLGNAGVELSFVGPGDYTRPAEIFSQELAGTKRAPQPFLMPRIIPKAESVREHVERIDVTQSKMVLGFRTGERRDAAGQAAMRMMTAIYGQTPFSMLFLNVRERLSLCYYCAARYSRADALMLVDCGVESKNIERARGEILVQLRRLQDGDFDDEAMENTRLLLKGGLRAVSDSAGALEDWYLNRLILGTLCSPEEELALLDGVTRDAVIEAARAVSLDTVYLLTGKGKEEKQ
jgi:predicted Zn-dependent peptidase